MLEIIHDYGQKLPSAFWTTFGKHMKEWCSPNLDEGSMKVAGPHFPRYMKKGKSDSYTYPSDNDFPVVTDMNGRCKNKRKLRLGKLKGHIICYNQSTPMNGTVRIWDVSVSIMHRSHTMTFLRHIPNPRDP